MGYTPPTYINRHSKDFEAEVFTGQLPNKQGQSTKGRATSHSLAKNVGQRSKFSTILSTKFNNLTNGFG